MLTTSYGIRYGAVMVIKTRSALMARLLELQGTRSDTEMAELFGVTRSYWSFLRAGKRAMSLHLIRRALELYPELAGYHLLDVQPRRTAAEEEKKRTTRRRTTAASTR